MNIFRTSSKNKFISEVVDFICAYNEDFSKLKILLPNGLTCSELQKSLIEIKGTTILPTIIPISELIAEEEEIFKIPSTQFTAITRLEEKISLAEVIYSYKKLNYNLLQSLRLSTSLAQLFFEFESNNLLFESIKNLPILDESEHWSRIYSFLHFAQGKWSEAIKRMNKITRSAHQAQAFQAEINRLYNNPEQSLIVAGVIGDNQITNMFIKKALELKNFTLILPPFDQNILKNKLSFDNPLYKIQKFILSLEQNNNINLKTLGEPKETIIDKLIHESKSETYNDNIEYVELENIFHEAEYIALKCQEHIKNHIKCNICLIVNSQEMKEHISLFLQKYELNYNDLFGKNILAHPVISLILLISELQYSAFSLEKLFAFLSHPEIIDDTIIKVKNIIRQNNRIASTFESVEKTITKYGNKEIIEKFSYLTQFINKNNTTNNQFHNLLLNTLQAVELIQPNIWKKYSDINLPLLEILNQEWKIEISDIKEFSELLKQLFDGGRIIESHSQHNITICRANDSALINYDLVIITDMNENNYPKLSKISPWLNLQMQKELGLDSKISAIGSSLYEFYLNMNNEKIILTRAKNFSGTQTIQSPFILHLQYILKRKLNTRTAILENNGNIKIEKELYANSQMFPKQISATDIEMLIRSPYNFYTKKILGLRKSDEISDSPNLADFGNFFHKVIEEYTNNFPEKSIEEIAHTHLEELNIPKYNKNAWKTKILAIAPEFSEFELNRREKIKSVYCEIRGTWQLKLVETEVKVIAIADRIEVGKDGSACIIDYKTGTVPTKKDIFSGMSPQLLIAAMILSENGFDIETNKVKKIIYVKINSQKPYIKISEIELSKTDIENHKNGISALLSHYIKTSEYPIEPCNMKYDDYTHFARRIF